jgi:hypothetical protein
MTALLAEDVPLVLLTSDGRVRGRLETPSATHVDLRRRQLARHSDQAARLTVARAFVQGKIHNQDVLLRRRAARSARPDEIWELARRVTALGTRAAGATSIAELNGLEGAASAAYFRGLRVVLDPALGFRRRERTDTDIVNMLVNYCSALLREVVFGAVLAAGLDPCTSFLHTPTAGRPTLVFDLMEEWRPVLLEPTVLALVGLRIVRPEHITTATATGFGANTGIGRPPVFPRRSPRDLDDMEIAPGAVPPTTTAATTEATSGGHPANIGYPATGGQPANTEDPAFGRDPAAGGEAPPRPTGTSRLAPEATAAAVTRFRTRLDAPARGWPHPGGRGYGAQIRAQVLALRTWVADLESPYVPFAWR